MANRRRQSRRARARTGRPAGDLVRRPAVWLTTLSTIVGVATGMFTLRDRVFPRESGGAEASLDVYRQAIGRICDQLNADDMARVAGDRRLAKALRRARTTTDERNALLESARRSIARSAHDLASLRALKPPRSVLADHRTTEQLWGEDLERLRGYAQRLDTAEDRRDVDAAIALLPAMRTKLSDDGVTIDANLKRLAGGQCQLDLSTVTKPITLRRYGGRVRPQVNGSTPGAMRKPSSDPSVASGRPEGSGSARKDGGSRTVPVDPSVNEPPAGSDSGPSVNEPPPETVPPDVSQPHDPEPRPPPTTDSAPSSP
jgi:hypothetical protein